MPKYVVVSNHLPNTGPSSNKMIKESNKTLQAGFQPLMQKLKIKPEVLLRFDPGTKCTRSSRSPIQKQFETSPSKAALSGSTTSNSQ